MTSIATNDPTSALDHDGDNWLSDSAIGAHLQLHGISPEAAVIEAFRNAVIDHQIREAIAEAQQPRQAVTWLEPIRVAALTAG